MSLSSPNQRLVRASKHPVFTNNKTKLQPKARMSNLTLMHLVNHLVIVNEDFTHQFDMQK